MLRESKVPRRQVKAFLKAGCIGENSMLRSMLLNKVHGSFDFVRTSRSRSYNFARDDREWGSGVAWLKPCPDTHRVVTLM